MCYAVKALVHRSQVAKTDCNYVEHHLSCGVHEDGSYQICVFHLTIVPLYCREAFNTWVIVINLEEIPDLSPSVDLLLDSC